MLVDLTCAEMMQEVIGSPYLYQQHFCWLLDFALLRIQGKVFETFWLAVKLLNCVFGTCRALITSF